MFHSVSLFGQAPLACGSHALPSVLLEKHLAIHTFPFFHLLVNGFSVTSVRTFSKTLTFFIVVGSIGGQGGIKMASTKNNQLISPQGPHLVHTVQLILRI